MAENNEYATKAIDHISHLLDNPDLGGYERRSLHGLLRSWTLDDPVCQALALQDAQVWATLHLARATRMSK